MRDPFLLAIFTGSLSSSIRGNFSCTFITHQMRYNKRLQVVPKEHLGLYAFLYASHIFVVNFNFIFEMVLFTLSYVYLTLDNLSFYFYLYMCVFFRLERMKKANAILH